MAIAAAPVRRPRYPRPAAPVYWRLNYGQRASGRSRTAQYRGCHAFAGGVRRPSVLAESWSRRSEPWLAHEGACAASSSPQRNAHERRRGQAETSKVTSRRRQRAPIAALLATEGPRHQLLGSRETREAASCAAVADHRFRAVERVAGHPAHRGCATRPTTSRHTARLELLPAVRNEGFSIHCPRASAWGPMVCGPGGRRLPEHRHHRQLRAQYIIIWPAIPHLQDGLRADAGRPVAPARTWPSPASRCRRRRSRRFGVMRRSGRIVSFVGYPTPGYPTAGCVLAKHGHLFNPLYSCAALRRAPAADRAGTSDATSFPGS